MRISQSLDYILSLLVHNFKNLWEVLCYDYKKRRFWWWKSWFFWLLLEATIAVGFSTVLKLEWTFWDLFGWIGWKFYEHGKFLILTNEKLLKFKFLKLLKVQILNTFTSQPLINQYWRNLILSFITPNVPRYYILIHIKCCSIHFCYFPLNMHYLNLKSFIMLPTMLLGLLQIFDYDHVTSH